MLCAILQNVYVINYKCITIIIYKSNYQYKYKIIQLQVLPIQDIINLYHPL